MLGGVLTTELSWRWIFLVNLPVGIVAIAITLTKVQEFRAPQARRIDVVGFLVFTLGLQCGIEGAYLLRAQGAPMESVLIRNHYVLRPPSCLNSPRPAQLDRALDRFGSRCQQKNFLQGLGQN